jgi:hypothetical protein
MKKILLIFILGVFSLGLSAQNAYVRAAKHVQGWGQSGDTLTASVTKNYVVRVKSSDLLRMSVSLRTDSVSGTPAYSCYLQYSNDGVNYVDLDTVATTTGVDSFNIFSPMDAVYNYYRLKIVATAGAQKANLYNYWTFRKKND